MKKYLLLLLAVSGFAQTPFSGGIKTSRIDGYVNQDISINSTTGGLLIPRMTTTQKEAISSPTMFTQVIDVTLGKHQYYDGSVWVDSFGGGSHNLQQVTDNGATTTNTIIVGDLEATPTIISVVSPESVATANSGTATATELSATEGVYIGTVSGGDGQKVNVRSDNISESYVVQHPDKTGEQTYAMLSDLGGGGSTPTELTAVLSPTAVVINSSTQTGAGATIGLTDGTNAGLLSPAEKTKLAGIASGATANQSDATTNAAIALKENSANKQNSLTVDGTGTKFLTVDAANNGLQPLDSDLTAIAALTTDSFGRGVLTQTSAANARTYIGAGTGNGTVTNVTGVSGETTVANGTTTPVIGIAPAYTTARDAVANGKVMDAIVDGVTTVAPSQNAVFDALALKANLASPTFTGTVTIPSAGLSITGSSGNTYFLRADGTQSGLPISNTIQGNAIGTDNGVNAIITNVMSNRQGFWNLQKQISFLQMLNVVQSVSTYALPITNNQIYVTHTGTTATYTFPTLANGTGIQYTIINMGSGTITLNSNAGGSDIYDSGTSSASVTILSGQTAVIYGNGTKFVML